jgi:hypothetical protein
MWHSSILQLYTAYFLGVAKTTEWCNHELQLSRADRFSVNVFILAIYVSEKHQIHYQSWYIYLLGVIFLFSQHKNGFRIYDQKLQWSHHFDML